MREAEEEYCDAGFEWQVITYIVYTYIYLRSNDNKVSMSPPSSQIFVSKFHSQLKGGSAL